MCKVHVHFERTPPKNLFKRRRPTTTVVDNIAAQPDHYLTNNQESFAIVPSGRMYIYRQPTASLKVLYQESQLKHQR